MIEFRGRIAVVTGAGSGIGRAIAGRCAEEGMSVVLADINEADLAQAELELREQGATILAVRTDVSKRADIEALAQRTLDTYGAVHLLINNAGVAAGSSIWESTWADWQWVIGVNLWGVIYGIKVFVPIMLAQDTECHIVNTASVAGLISDFPSASYHVTKHAVVALSENLYHSLVQRHARISVSVLCPGFVKTRIMDAGRNRPPELANPPAEVNPEEQAIEESFSRGVEAGMSPREVTEHVFRAISEERFYVLTDPKYKDAVRTRMEAILNDRNPSPG